MVYVFSKKVRCKTSVAIHYHYFCNKLNSFMFLSPCLRVSVVNCFSQVHSRSHLDHPHLLEVNLAQTPPGSGHGDADVGRFHPEEGGGVGVGSHDVG